MSTSTSTNRAFHHRYSRNDPDLSCADRIPCESPVAIEANDISCLKRGLRRVALHPFCNVTTPALEYGALSFLHDGTLEAAIVFLKFNVRIWPPT